MTTVGARSRAAKSAASALAKIAEQGLSPLPKYYSVWYHYFDGDSPELQKALDKHLETDPILSEYACEELFNQYCVTSAASPSVTNFAESVVGELHQVLETIESTGKNAADYGQSLESVSGEMTQGISTEKFRELIERAISMTQSMVEHSRSVEHSLMESVATIDRLSDELRMAHRDASTDGLTGLANRAEFDRRLRSSISEIADKGRPLSMLLLDIDYFKQFNDTYGHPVGDEVLRLLGAVLKQEINGKDVTARYGGEEFAVILRDSVLASAGRIGEQLRAAVAKKSIVDRSTGNKLGRITVSVGASQFIDGESAEEFVDRADKGLYKAKKRGRDRVVCESVE